ncbi:MAG: PEP-CTERM sorting domain-containing protein [bacterium]
MKRSLRYLIAVAVLASPSTASAQLIGSSGGKTLCCFGATSTHTYGQTITAPVGAAALQDFSFWLGGSLNYSGGSRNFDFNAYVFDWDESAHHASGAALFASAPISAPTGPGLTQIAVNTGNTPVIAGRSYIVMFSFDQLTNSGAGYVPFAWSDDPNSYAGGYGAWFNNAVIGEVSSTAWDGPWEAGDWQFEAAFDQGIAGPQYNGLDLVVTPQDNDLVVTPEPASLVLLGTGLACVFGLARRRRCATK